MRFSIVGTLLCAFVLGSALLVQRRGEAYRAALASARRARYATAGKTAGEDSEVASSRSGRAGTETTALPSPAAKPAQSTDALPAAENGADQAGLHAQATTAVTHETVGSVPARQATPNGPPPEMIGLSRTDDKNVNQRSAQWKNDPFWSQSALLKPWPLDELTTQDEQRLGAELNSVILRFNSLDSGPGLRRVKEAADPLLNRLSLTGARYQFFVLDSEVPNVFSHPGRYVYVSRKLLELTPEEEPSVLEFALGHEIAHVELRHAINCLKDKGVQKLGDGTLQKLYFLIIPFGYPDDLELAADTWVYQHMEQLGRSEHDRLKFLRKVDHYARANDFGNGRGKPHELWSAKRAGIDAVGRFSPVENHLRSHPPAYDRIRQLKRLSKG